LILFVALIITGKSVHSFQELGILTSHSLPVNLSFDLFGIYPTWEVLFAQIFLFTACWALLKFLEKKRQSPP